MLPAEARLTKRRDFSHVYARGKAKACPAFVLYTLKKRGDVPRIGFSVSKKVGNAVVRNRVKRVFRHATREILSGFCAGYDYVFVIRKNALTLTQKQIVSSMRNMLAKCGNK